MLDEAKFTPLEEKRSDALEMAAQTDPTREASQGQGLDRTLRWRGVSFSSFSVNE